MLNSVCNLGALCVVEAIERSDEISGYSADSFKAVASLGFLSAALGAGVSDYTGKAAARVSVNRVIDRTVANAGFLHAADNLFKRGQILKRIAVKLNVADVSGVCKSMVRSFNLDFCERIAGIVYRYMEGVGIILSVGNTRDNAVLLPINSYESAGKTLCRSSKQ